MVSNSRLALLTGWRRRCDQSDGAGRADGCMAVDDVIAPRLAAGDVWWNLQWMFSERPCFSESASDL